jgi:hypothetical protein
MKILDAGHKFELDHLDGYGKQVLTFVKREGEGFPGNIGSYEGTNIQEVIRSLISRVHYLDNQIPDENNQYVIAHLRMALRRLEVRAANRHKRPHPAFLPNIEDMPVCSKCGHLGHQCEEA